MRSALLVIATTVMMGCGTGSEANGIAPTASTDEAALSSSETFACEIHYYDSASLPNPHIFVAAKGSATVSDLSKSPIVLSSSDAISGTAQIFTRGSLTVQAFSGADFLASGAYRLSTSRQFVTDLQMPMAPITKDGVTYDRLWIGCFPQQ